MHKNACYGVMISSTKIEKDPGTHTHTSTEKRVKGLLRMGENKFLSPYVQKRIHLFLSFVNSKEMTIYVETKYRKEQKLKTALGAARWITRDLSFLYYIFL